VPLSDLVPQITVVAKDQKTNLLDIGHRIADAAVRFSELESEARDAIIKLEKKGNALDLARLAPTSLVFGFWDSRETQFKFGRVLASVIRATNVSIVSRSLSE
jgi:CRISPR-associated protein Csb1